MDYTSFICVTRVVAKLFDSTVPVIFINVRMCFKAMIFNWLSNVRDFIVHDRKSKKLCLLLSSFLMKIILA